MCACGLHSQLLEERPVLLGFTHLTSPPPRPPGRHQGQKKNPLKNINVMLRLNPYMKTQRRRAILEEIRRKAAKAKKADEKRV